MYKYYSIVFFAYLNGIPRIDIKQSQDINELINGCKMKFLISTIL